MSDENKTDTPTGALRFDNDKPQTYLLCPIAMEGLSAVLTMGAKKYAPGNWTKGMKWSRCINSLLRHLFKYMAGEDLDKESGLPHIDHVLCNAMFLSNYFRRHKDKDDRIKYEDSNMPS
jgi:hypothetical protein